MGLGQNVLLVDFVSDLGSEGGTEKNPLKMTRSLGIFIAFFFHIFRAFFLSSFLRKQ